MHMLSPLWRALGQSLRNHIGAIDLAVYVTVHSSPSRIQRVYPKETPFVCVFVSLVYVFRKISIPSVSKGIDLIGYRQFKHFNSANFRADIFAQLWELP